MASNVFCGRQLDLTLTLQNVFSMTFTHAVYVCFHNNILNLTLS